MRFKTNLTAETIARYNAMNWNHGEDIYCLAPCGDCWEDILRDTYNADPEYIVDLDALRSDTEWQIHKHEQMLDEDEPGHCHQWYLDGDRDERTMAGIKIWLKARREIASYKRDLAEWVRTAITCEPHWMDTDDISIDFDEHTGKARA